MAPDNLARLLKTFSGLAPYESIAKIRTTEPDRFIVNPIHQMLGLGFFANVYAIPSDLFPRGMSGSVIGLGGLDGAVGGMLMAKFAGAILVGVGSYDPIFMVAGCAYFAALLVVHLLLTQYSPVVVERLL